jgi:hypothetical protein
MFESGSSSIGKRQLDKLDRNQALADLNTSLVDNANTWSYFVDPPSQARSDLEPAFLLNGLKREETDLTGLTDEAPPLHLLPSRGVSPLGGSLFSQGSPKISYKTVSGCNFMSGSRSVKPCSGVLTESNLSSALLPSPASFARVFGEEFGLIPADPQVNTCVGRASQFASMPLLCSADLEEGFERAFKPHSQGMMTLLSGTATVGDLDWCDYSAKVEAAPFSQILSDEVDTNTQAQELFSKFAASADDANGNVDEPWKGVPLSYILGWEQQLRTKGKYGHLPQEFLMKFIGRLDVNGLEQSAWRCYISGCPKECIRRDHAVDHIRMHLNDRGWPCHQW